MFIPIMCLQENELWFEPRFCLLWTYQILWEKSLFAWRKFLPATAGMTSLLEQSKKSSPNVQHSIADDTKLASTLHVIN